MSKNLVIFDCDGVLVDSEYVSSRVFSEALACYGYRISTEECIRRFTGVNAHDCRQVIMEESGLTIPENYWALQQPALLKAYETELTSLMKPVLEILDILKIPRCVASNSSRKHVVHSLEFTKQDAYFNERSIFTSQQVPNAKPAPDLFLFAAKEMGVNPENCIVVEDSSTGTNAGIAAGMQVMMFLGGSHARYDWYRAQMAVHDKPMLSTCNELLEAILQALK
ncbi:MAG: HAD family hydrolase [Parachlamydiaceae bacterium]|nr:HAD family hydrolase [Parachlamydiaceae bacterium]